jgi:hypothetical protein
VFEITLFVSANSAALAVVASALIAETFVAIFVVLFAVLEFKLIIALVFAVMLAVFALIFTVFDRPALYTMLEKNYSTQSPMNFYTRAHNTLPGDDHSAGRGIPGFATANNPTGWTKDVVKKTPYYADQIPPFDITVTFVNEYGNAAARSIYGVELLNEGSGASMDDIVIEETMTYVARELGPMYTIQVDRNNDATLSDPARNGLNTEIIRP